MFKKEDLKFGDLITDREGRVYICDGDGWAYTQDDSMDLDYIDDNLKNTYYDSGNYDIMKIQRYVPSYNIHSEYSEDRLYYLTTLYDRSKTFDMIELKKAIEKEFNCTVKEISVETISDSTVSVVSVNFRKNDIDMSLDIRGKATNEYIMSVLNKTLVK